MPCPASSEHPGLIQEVNSTTEVYPLAPQLILATVAVLRCSRDRVDNKGDSFPHIHSAKIIILSRKKHLLSIIIYINEIFSLKNKFI